MASWETNIDPNVEAARQEQIARRRHEVLSGKVSTLPGDSVQRKARTVPDGK